MGKSKSKSKDKSKSKAAELLRVPLFSEHWAREHLLEHHGIATHDDQPVMLLAAIHQADHVAAGVGGRPIVVPHYHTADVQRKDDDR